MTPIRLGPISRWHLSGLSTAVLLEMLFSDNRYYCCLLWSSTVGYSSDSLASCLSCLYPHYHSENNTANEHEGIHWIAEWSLNQKLKYESAPLWMYNVGHDIAYDTRGFTLNESQTNRSVETNINAVPSYSIALLIIDSQTPEKKCCVYVYSLKRHVFETKHSFEIKTIILYFIHFATTFIAQRTSYSPHVYWYSQFIILPFLPKRPP